MKKENEAWNFNIKSLFILMLRDKFIENGGRQNESMRN